MWAGVGESGSPTPAVREVRAKALRAAGEHVIGFGAGEPDSATPEHIVGAVAGGAESNGTTTTRRRAGCPSSGGLRRKDPSGTRDSRWAASQVLVTNGGKQAVAETFAALLDPGDEVLVPAPN